MKKIYTGIEILQMIENGELKENTRLIDECHEEYICEMNNDIEELNLYIIDGKDKYQPTYYNFIDTTFTIINDETTEQEKTEKLKEIEFKEGQYPGQKIEILHTELNKVIKILNKLVKEKDEN